MHAVFLALLILCAHSWGECTLHNGYSYSDFRCSQLNGSLSSCQGAFDCSGNHCWNPAWASSTIVPVRGFYCDNNTWAKCSYYQCLTQAEADSLYCVLNPQADGCRTPDTTWTCTSVFSENNVIRSYVQKYVDGVPVGNGEMVLYSCRQNGFCEGSYNAGQLANDSCTYDSISTENCRYGGQDGSACYYVCPDGKNHMCRMKMVGGDHMAECPSKPWKSCADTIERTKPPNEGYDPSTYNPPPDSLSQPPDDMPDGSADTEILLAIRDTLHHANEQRKYQMYVEEKIYDVIGGVTGEGLLPNLKEINANTRGTQVAARDAATNTANLVTAVGNLVTIMQQDTVDVRIASPESLYVYSSATPLVFRMDTTLLRQEAIMDEIRALTDTLVSDTPRTNTILGRVVPSLDSALTFFVDRSPVGMVQSMASAFADSIQSKIQPFVDYVTVDSVAYDSALSFVDSLGDALAPSLLPYDTSQGIIHFETLSLGDIMDSIKSVVVDNPFTRFERFNDSVTQRVDSILQERADREKHVDSIPLDSMSSDSAKIRDKLNMVFLTDEIVESCFDFHLNHQFRITVYNKTYTWDLALLVDFADLFGLDLCELIRKIVQVLTFILIVFTTVKGYIRAFGGNGL